MIKAASAAPGSLSGAGRQARFHTGIANVPTALAAGIAIGLAAATAPPVEFEAGLTLLVPLCITVVWLSKIVERSDERLRAGDASYRAFFEHAVEGIFRTTQDGRYLDANPALAAIYGYETPRALMNGLTDIAAQLYVDVSRREDFRALMQADDQVLDFVSEIRKRDGSRIWISENARAVRDWIGRIVSYEGTVENITEKVLAEQAMTRALREAEQASQSKSAFLAAMSHELKTPLNAVIGFSEILSTEMFGPLGSDSYRSYAHDILISGKRLLGIVDDVLDVARLEGGAITISANPIGIPMIVENGIALARLSTGDNRSISVSLVPVLPLANVDAGRLSQALANLVANALKFTPKAGRIAVKATRDECGDVRLSVSDTGIGMAPERVASAFEAFRQLDGTIARRFEGAGLGLPIARALVELHGGSLELQSELGRGTVASIRLPPARLVFPRGASLASGAVTR